ncbi:MAG: cysteine--tRNA ligase [Deltaproteobacteria bacterium]|nr:cysteine--tRNA ligase [Deltaproteobacteria bacterium]
MSLRFHNTLSGRLEEFVPLVSGKVGVYVCGVTVYDRSHIGHARALVTFDVLYRYLKFSGYEVTFVRNFTDVDDKIIARAQQAGISTADLVETNIRSFAEDVKAMGCESPTVEPRATENVDGMIALIQELIDKGLAYPADGDVYFAVDKFRDYGKLSKRKLDDMIAGSRVEVDERKHHPMDFALWKASKPGEPWWESPWGQGRPGWHIECSVMSTKHLGQPFDIHGGGTDLIFPHHENEIAQSEGAKGKAFARYWLHNGMVNIGAEKMSKSLGNFMTVQQAAGRVGGEAVRLFVIGTHYRSPLDFSPDRLDESGRALTRLYETLARVDEALKGEAEAGPAPAVLEEFRTAMDDDLNTARAVGIVFETVRTMNRLLDEGKVDEVGVLRSALKEISSVLGIGGTEAVAFLERSKQDHLADAEIDPAEIENLISQRNAARREKNFKRADEIRDQLKALGIVLEDTPKGTIWKIEKR